MEYVMRSHILRVITTVEDGSEQEHPDLEVAELRVPKGRKRQFDFFE